MSSLQKLMTELALPTAGSEMSIKPETKYLFYALSQTVWIRWITDETIHEHVWCRCSDFRVADLTAKMLNYAAYCQGCSTLETCPPM